MRDYGAIAMRVLTAVVVLVLAATAVFALMNPALVGAVSTARLPGGSYTGPLLSTVLLLAAVAVLAMYGGTALWYYLVTNRTRKIEMLLARQQGQTVPVIEEPERVSRKIVEELSQKIESVRADRKIADELSQKIESVRVELSEQIVELGRVFEDRLSDLAALATQSSEPS